MRENQKWSKEAEFLRSIFRGTTDAQRIAALEAKLAVARESLRWYARDCTIGEDMAQRALQEIEQ